MSLLKDIKENWVLILFVGSLIIGWTSFSNRLATAEDKIESQQQILQQISQIQTDIAVIKTDVQYLKVNLK